MKKESLQIDRKFRIGLCCAVMLGLILVTLLFGTGPVISTGVSAGAPEPAFQTLPKPWTAVGSSGVVDESSLNVFAFGTADIAFRAGATATVVVARYNVTNTFDNNANPNRPGWTTLEMGSNAPINTIIEAKLFEIKACGTDPVLLCTARNRSNDTPCAKCTINSTIDFTNKLYFVEVTLNRNSANNASPRMFTLRVF
jgi:hypothetical protein